MPYNQLVFVDSTGVGKIARNGQYFLPYNGNNKHKERN